MTRLFFAALTLVLAGGSQEPDGKRIQNSYLGKRPPALTGERDHWLNGREPRLDPVNDRAVLVVFTSMF